MHLMLLLLKRNTLFHQFLSSNLIAVFGAVEHALSKLLALINFYFAQISTDRGNFLETQDIMRCSAVEVT